MIKRHEPENTFPRFWSAYPRHDAKKYALKAWVSLDPDEALIAVILEALAWQRQSKQWTDNDGKYIPHASTWLHGERWNDEKARTAPALPTMTRFASLGMHREIK